MTMTAEEIVREYREARYPEKQIRILADENSCGVSNIKEILLAAGCELPRSRKPKAEMTKKGSASRWENGQERKTPEKPEDLPFLPAPAGAGEYQDEAAQAEKSSGADVGPSLPDVLPAEPLNEDTVSAGEALPLIMRTSAVDVIARLLKDAKKTPEGYSEFTEQVRGVLALVHEVETSSKEI